MTRAVFDTNVVVSGFLSPHGPPGRIVDWLREGTVCAILDDRITDEYKEVLGRPVLDLPAMEVSIVLRSIFHHGLWVTASAETASAALPDPDNAAFLECARAAGVPLVTGNVRHYPKGIAGTVPIMTPVDFIRLYSVKNP